MRRENKFTVGLPNRRLLLDRFRLALSASARSNRYGALLFLDMDRFKTLNDTLGHDIGDLLLVEVARRIQSCVREVDTVARLGGDEFVVLLNDVNPVAEAASQQAALIAEKIRESLCAPYQLKDKRHYSSPSIGVCLYRGQEKSIDCLLKYADMAMYQVKASGRNGMRFYDPLMQQAVETRASLEADLYSAVAGQEQFLLYYQAQVNSSGGLVGAEVLLRWSHPRRGMVPPIDFIPIAEETGLILPLGHWVLKSACQQLAAWAVRPETAHLSVAVNVSVKQFNIQTFVEEVLMLIEYYRVDPEKLKLEITESLLLDNVAEIITKMHILKNRGISFSMDDFGTGFSSLSLLKRLPLCQLKIDQSFVRDILTDHNDAAISKMIINLAQSLNLAVIAEGVETREQQEFLDLNGCHAFQGYLYSKPVPVEQFEALLQRLG